MKAKSTLLLLLSAVIISQNICAQNTFPTTGSAGIGTTTPAASSILEVKSTTQGILIPRMTGNQKSAIVSPAIGLMIYQTNGASGFYYYNGTQWTALSTKGATKSLSNLTSPTAVNVDLLPGINNSINIGNSSLRWKDVNLYNLKFADGTVQTTASTSSVSQWTISGSNIYYNNGNVGIGTTTPRAKLEVNGDAYINGLTVGSGAGNGGSNAVFGNHALFSNTTGKGNIALGSYAQYKTLTMGNQIAIGDSALYNCILNIGYITEPNIAVGAQALFANTFGYSNTAMGYQALYSNTTGALNTAMGQGALHNNTIAQFNTAIGETTLYYNTGYANTALGYAALDFSTTASSNVALGAFAMINNNTGYSNTTAGTYSLANNTTGSSNTAIGDSAALNDISSSYNTDLGKWAGYGVANGSNNTYVGYFTGPTIPGLYNCTGLGSYATPTASNQIRFGNGSVTSIGGQVSYTTLSDGRFKKNIKENVPGLEFINQLKPITYTLDIAGIKQFKGEDKKEAVNNQKSDNALEEKTIHTGFVAQDVEAIAKKMNYDFDGVDAAKNSKDLYGLRYAEFVVPLVKGEQELSKQNDSLITIVTSLQQQINELKAMMVSGNQSSSNNVSQINKQTVELNAVATLSQNIPNPFSNSTTINYYLPVNNVNAYINFYGLNGTILKSVKLEGNGKGNINLKASELPSGAYRYTLFVDGKILDSKQMILTK